MTAGKGLRQKHRWNTHRATHSTLPDALKLAILRGEACYRQRFCDYFASRGFDDAFAYLAYQKMYLDSQMLVEFVQQIGLCELTEDYIKHGIANQESDYRAQCYQLYCLLIDYLQQQHPDMLEHATTALIHHYLPSYFPKSQQVKPSLDSLKKQLNKALNHRWHCQVTVKESFTTSEDCATMRLIAHVDKCYPTELICLQEKRLRSARFKAYHRVLECIDRDEFTLTPKGKPSKQARFSP